MSSLISEANNYKISVLLLALRKQEKKKMKTEALLRKSIFILFYFLWDTLYTFVRQTDTMI